MLRTDTVLLKPTPPQEKELFYLAEQSSLLWNQASYQRRQAFFKHEKIPGYAKQCYAFKTSSNFKEIGTGKVHLTKKIAELQSQLNQKQYASKRIQKMFRKRQRRFKHAVNSMLKNLFERAAAMRITHIAVGDLNGIRNGNNLGKHTNQKLHNFWSHASIVKRIRELGEEFCIRIKLVSEAMMLRWEYHRWHQELGPFRVERMSEEFQPVH